MTKELLLFEIPEPSSRDLWDQGMKKAIDHANQLNSEWSETAFNFALQYVRTHEFFMAEDIRSAAYGIVPEPPSFRSYGAIITRLVKYGAIHRSFYDTVLNPKAHMAVATCWASLYFKK